VHQARGSSHDCRARCEGIGRASASVATGGCYSGGGLLALGTFGFGDHFGGAWNPEGQQVRVHEQGARPRGRMNEVRSLRLKRLTTFADGNVSTRVRDSPARDTHAELDSPQLSRRAGGPFVARRLRSKHASRDAIVTRDAKCRRSDAEASEGATSLSCRQVRVPIDRLEHPMLPAQAVCCYRRGKFQRSHNRVGGSRRTAVPLCGVARAATAPRLPSRGIIASRMPTSAPWNSRFPPPRSRCYAEAH
jgi:hypothetical protein